MKSSAAATERERPEIRNVEDFWCWLNTWGDRGARTQHRTFQRIGYEMAICDAMRALAEAGVDFDAVTDEAWKRWSRRR